MAGAVRYRFERLQGALPMTDAELSDVLKNGGSVPVPYFDNASVEILTDGIEDTADPMGVVTPSEALTSLKNFLNLTPDHRRSDARHLVAYCKMMMDAVGEEEILEDIGGVMPSADTIWTYAKPKLIFFSVLDPGQFADTRTIYLQIEGAVTWEPEHGLQMSWENGATLVKVGAYDGHPTNGHGSANSEHDAYVFYSNQPELATKREGN